MKHPQTKLNALNFIISFFLLIIFSSPGHPLFSQENKTDSLMLLLKTSSVDTNYINTALDIAWQFMYTNTDSAKIFAEDALTASKKIQNKLLIANSLNTIGVTHIVKGSYQKALFNLERGLEVAKTLLSNEPDNKKYKRRILAIYTNIGNAHYYLGEYSEAIENYLKAYKFSEEIGFVIGMANTLSNIGASYKDLMNFPKALEYNYKSLALAQKTGDSYWLSQSLNNLGSVYYSVPDYDSARYYFTTSMKMFEKENNEFELINSYVNMGSIFQKLNKYDSSLIYYKKGIQLSKKLSSADGLINAYYMIGELYDTLGNYTEAINYLNQSVKLAEETGTTRFIMIGNEELSDVYEKMRNYQKALLHYKKGSVMRDSIFNEKHDKRIAEMEAKYQTKEKEEKIKLLTQQNKLEKAQSENRQIILISVITILLLLLIAIFLAYRSYQHKQIALRSMIKQKADKRVLDAVIKTEIRERKHFAEELHDAMGALLSTLKLYINELSDKSNTEKEQEELLSRSNSLLDEAITNARTIAHNIMPASIKENGLEFSLRSLVDKINSSGQISVNFTTSGIRQHYQEIIELSVYRVLTEMINNTLKHAEATTIEISLIEKNKKLYINYKDNGIGFDYNQTIETGQKGLGLKNILSRIKMIGGTHRITSSKGKGFTAFIMLDIK